MCNFRTSESFCASWRHGCLSSPKKFICKYSYLCSAQMHKEKSASINNVKNVNKDQNCDRLSFIFVHICNKKMNIYCI